MELTRDILNSSEEIIRSVINGELTESEIAKIKRLIEKSSNEEELNNKLERYKKQIEQILLTASNTLEMKLNEEQERKIRAIVAEPTNKEKVLNEFYYVTDELKEQNKEKIARKNYWFERVERRLVSRGLTKEEKGYIIKVLETTPNEERVEIELSSYANKLVEKDIQESVEKIKPPKIDKRFTDTSEYRDWRLSKPEKRYKKEKGTSVKNRKGPNYKMRRIIAGILATGAVVGTIGISNYIGDARALNVQKNFSEEKMEQILENEEQQEKNIKNIDNTYEFYIDNTDKLTPDRLKAFAKRIKQEIESILETKLNKASKDSDYDTMDYGYIENGVDSQYYIKMGDELYGSQLIELVVGNHMSYDLTNCIEILEELDFPDEIEEKDMNKYIRIIRKAKKEMDELAKKDIRMGRHIKTTDKTVEHEDDEGR